MQIQPLGWKEFTSGKPADWRISGIDACHVYLAYEQWEIEHDAGVALKQLKDWHNDI